MKYKVGDKVKIRQWEDMKKEFDVTNGCINTRLTFTPEMSEFCGEEMTISNIKYNKYYKLKEDSTGWAWTDEMFEDVETPKNHWKEIASWYGLELDEEFDIPVSMYNPYKFTEKGVVDCNGDFAIGWIRAIINGNCKIKKRPWKPKEGGNYYYVAPGGNILKSIFIGEMWAPDISMIKNGWCFKTKEEAEANKERVLKEYEEVLE